MSGKFRCCHCGDDFKPHQDTIDLLEEGFISRDSIDTCEECGRDILSNDNLPELYSDADSGL